MVLKDLPENGLLFEACGLWNNLNKCGGAFILFNLCLFSAVESIYYEKQSTCFQFPSCFFCGRKAHFSPTDFIFFLEQNGVILISEYLFSQHSINLSELSSLSNALHQHNSNILPWDCKHGQSFQPRLTSNIFLWDFQIHQNIGTSLILYGMQYIHSLDAVLWTF